MFRPTSPQSSLFESRFLLSEQKQRKLEASWAHDFRTRILPLVDEEAFRDAFCEDNGRPNKSIRLLIGLLLLKEVEDLTDDQVLDALRFNLQWHYALGVEPADADTCQKTLHNTRVRLLQKERARKAFEGMTAAIAKLDGLHTIRQRLDSTHLISNIAVLTRLGLFTETIARFLRELRKSRAVALTALDGGYAKRYLDREGYFGDATREEARRRLPIVAEDLHRLVKRFEEDAEVAGWESYQLLVRLLTEQCTVAEPVEGGPAAAPEDTPTVTLKPPEEIAGGSLQSPHDPDATYGHKGKGYESQIAETCHPDNPYEVITGVEITSANGSDQNATLPMLERLEAAGMKPKELIADTGYGSGENIVGAAEMGVALLTPVQDPGAPDDVHDGRPTEGNSAAEEPTCATGEAPASVLAAEPSSPVGAAPLDLADFAFNATFSEVRMCPAGVAPEWQDVTDTAYFAGFPADLCATCPLAARCPARLLADGTRKLRWRDTRAATATRQRQQRTASFKEGYRIRSGIESTNAELEGRHGAGELRVRRRARVEVAMYLKALALNAKRAVQHHNRVRTAARANEVQR